MKTFLRLGCVLALISSASAQTPLLQYTFDEASGPALDTGSGVPSPGTLNGGAVRSATAPGGLGSAVDFRTDSPYAHVLGQDAAKLDGINQVTLTTWLNLSAYTSGNNRLAAKQNAGTFGGFNWSMNATPNSGTVGPDNFRLGMFIGNNVSSGAADFAAVFSNDDVGALNRWVFLAVSYDGTTGTDNIKFYMGDEDSPVTLVGTPLSTIQITLDGGPARFGVGFTDAAPTSNTSALGLQDDVRVYGSVLDLAALDNVRLANVPEPSTYALIGIAASAVAFFRRKNSR